eukprot:463059-Rhodomonas_salina.1
MVRGVHGVQYCARMCSTALASAVHVSSTERAHGVQAPPLTFVALAPSTLVPPHTLHPRCYTLDPTPCTLHPKP